MKSIQKFLFVMAAFVAAVAFVSCGSKDDDGPSTVAVYSVDMGGTMETVTFLDDGTWTTTWDMAAGTLTVASGTYTGDPSKDGDVTIKVTKMAGADGKLQDVPADLIKEQKLTVKNGKTTYNEVPLTRR